MGSGKAGCESFYLILRSGQQARVSKDEASWFETRRFAALLTMRICFIRLWLPAFAGTTSSYPSPGIDTSNRYPLIIKKVPAMPRAALPITSHEIPETIATDASTIAICRSTSA
jgi:hypothetical protein